MTSDTVMKPLQVSSPYTNKVQNIVRETILKTLVLHRGTKHVCYLTFFRECEPTWQGMEERRVTTNSPLKSVVSVWLKFGNSFYETFHC